MKEKVEETEWGGEEGMKDGEEPKRVKKDEGKKNTRKEKISKTKTMSFNEGRRLTYKGKSDTKQRRCKKR